MGCCPFIIRSDHEGLICLLTAADASDKPARWRLHLLKFNFEVVYQDSIKQKAPDALSRLRTEETDTIDLDGELQMFMIDEIEVQHGIETKYFLEDQRGKEQTGNYMNSHGKERKLSALKNYRMSNEITAHASRQH